MPFINASKHLTDLIAYVTPYQGSKHSGQACRSSSLTGSANFVEPCLSTLENNLKDKQESYKLINEIYSTHTASSGSQTSTQPNLERSGPSRHTKKALEESAVQILVNSASPKDYKVPSHYFKGYHHATWYVSNAKQTAHYFVTALGFEYVAYRGLETGSKFTASQVVQNGDVVFEFISPLVASADNMEDNIDVQKIHEFIRRHGDGVRDVSFEVENIEYVYQTAVSAGAKPVHPPTKLSDDYGDMIVATIEVFDDLHHTLVQKGSYKGAFLPGYKRHRPSGTLVINSLPPISFEKIDHCVQNEDWNRLEDSCDVYKKIFGFHEFWSVDSNDVSTEYSALRSIVMASANEEVKMPINEPAEGICKSQIEEFLDFYNGPGVQHIAVVTNDIVSTVRNMKARGAEFIEVPELYYESLLPELLAAGVQLDENLSELKDLNILIDFDDKGYLLQIFTKPLTDRPTFFIEIIQRHNHKGFGKGNFKALFETIEKEQKLRGTLEKDQTKKTVA